MIFAYFWNREKAPGQRECDVAIDRINGALRTLDQASLAAVSQSLAPMDDNSMQGYQEQMQGSAHQILELIDEVKAAAKTEPEKLAHLVSFLAFVFFFFWEVFFCLLSPFFVDQLLLNWLTTCAL